MDFDKALELFEPVLGFEVHVELNTKTKMFSARTQLASDASRTRPRARSISGFPAPCRSSTSRPCSTRSASVSRSAARSRRRAGSRGRTTSTPTSARTIRSRSTTSRSPSTARSRSSSPTERVSQVPIERAHMEEDAGKLTHVGGSTGRIQGAEYSLVDYNRAGVPLVEIVTKPDLRRRAPRARDRARRTSQTIRDIVLALGISEARMERGNLRCDANVSLRPRAARRSSARAPRRRTSTRCARSSARCATRSSVRRPSSPTGGSITQETRHWHEDTGTTSPGRPKSDADDYRYFPEPDLLPVVPSAELIEQLRAALPEPPAERRRRLKAEWGFTDLEFQDVAQRRPPRRASKRRSRRARRRPPRASGGRARSRASRTLRVARRRI